jgi:hypothetical protein
MKTNHCKILGTGLALLALVNFSFANLTVTVQPGYSFGSNEQVTIGKLNQLGQPTIGVFGTLDGSVSLAAGSVNGSLLADTVPDGLTLGYNGSTPRQLTVTSAGLLDGTGGIWASNNFLHLAYDTNVFTLATNSPAVIGGGTNSMLSLTFKPGGAARALGLLQNYTVVGQSNGGAMTALDPRIFGQSPVYVQTVNMTNNGSISSQTVTSPILSTVPFQLPVYLVNGTTNIGYISPAAGNVITGPNPFAPVVPSDIRWVLVCVTNDAGYAIGDEVDVRGFYLSGGNAIPCYNSGANSSTIFMVANNSGNAFNILNKGTGTGTGINQSRWSAKCYLRP